MTSSTPRTSVSGAAARLLAASLGALFGAAMLAQTLLVAQTQPPLAGQTPPGAGAPAGQGQAAQPPQGQPPQDQRPTFRAGANLVRVDVYPTAGGKPVTDLTQSDFEVQEDGVPQKVDNFEHVVVRSPTAEEAAAMPEPNTVSQSRELAADAKARLFVLYLDTYHISRAGGLMVRDALLRFLRRTLGPDDLVAVMTPELPASAMTFGRRTGSIEDLVDRFYRWSRRDALNEYEPIEEQYMRCYPPTTGDTGGMSSIAREMIQRRREGLTLDSLKETVIHLGGIREERKAVLAVSEGWVLYQQSSSAGQSSRPPTSGLTPGQMMGSNAEQARCDADRYRLLQEDHQRDFYNMFQDANRANVSFYPLDPRGLVVFDTSIAEGDLDLQGDATRLRARTDSLRTLAENTDGVAIVNSNDIDKGLRRVVDDLTSYYLLGYYSTNTKLDGRFRSIKVTVKRKGVDVRARRGYRAATKEEMESRDKAIATAAAPLSPVAGALTNLSKVRPQSVVQAQAGYVWTLEPGGAFRPVLWLAGEWDPSSPASRDEQWKAGAEVSVAVNAPNKATLSNSVQTLTRESRAFFLRIPVPPGQTAGEYSVRLTSKPVGTSLGSTETVRVALPAIPAAGGIALGQPIAFRRGPFTGPNWLPAGDLRFRRQERVKIEFHVAGPITASAVRLLDRSGNPLNLPVATAEREEDGGKVISGEVTLAPLTVGDYVIEGSFTAGTTTQKVLAAFRIVP